MAQYQLNYKINRTYMIQLDALRAIAVFGVMLNHFLPEDLPLNAIIQPGSLGVRLFFVLSGFLITNILLQCKDIIDSTKQTPFFTLKRFYIRRFLRIFPIYYLIIIFGSVLNIQVVEQAFLWHFTYTSNIYFQFKGAWDIGTAHFWTLSIEEQFYLIWPFLIIFTPKQQLPKLLFSTVFIAPLFRFVCWVTGLENLTTMGNLLTLAWLDCLGIGAILAYVSYGENQSKQIEKNFVNFCFWTGLPAFTILHLVRITNPNESIFEVVWATTIISLFFAWLIGSAAKGFRGIAGKILEQKTLIYLGKISYGIYIYHLFVPLFIRRIFNYLELSYPSLELIQFAMNVVVSLIVSIASYHIIENPINSLKKYFEYTKTAHNFNR